MSLKVFSRNNSPFKDKGWQHTSTIPGISYTCGHCRHKVASEKCYVNMVQLQTDGIVGNNYILICPLCQLPTYFGDKGQIPGEPYGEAVKGLDEKPITKKIFDELLICYAANSFSAVILLGRKLIMHVACDQGAEENLKFVQYVDFLDRENIIPRNSKSWVTKIKDYGNELNHEIVVGTKEKAREIVDFTAMLLKLTYEFKDAATGS